MISALLCAGVAAAALAAGVPATVTGTAPVYPPDAPLVWRTWVSRTSPTRNAHGLHWPPWTSAKVSTVVPRPAKVGDAVLVLPLAPLAPVTSKVARVQAQPAIDAGGPTWVIDIDVTNRAFLEAKSRGERSDEVPFDVVVVFPAIEGARLVPRKTALADLPRAASASASTLKAAVDLTGDGKADAALFEYCGDHPAERFTTDLRCGFRCQATFLRLGGKAWALVADECPD
jgi:hypothetical protein